MNTIFVESVGEATGIVDWFEVGIYSFVDDVGFFERYVKNSLKVFGGGPGDGDDFFGFPYSCANCEIVGQTMQGVGHFFAGIEMQGEIMNCNH